MSYRVADSLLESCQQPSITYFIIRIVRKNPRCLNLHCATSFPLFTAYLIYLYAEWLAYLCLSFHIVFVSNLFSFLFYIEQGSGCSILILLISCQQTSMTYTIAVSTVKNSWWWTEKLSETCRVLFQRWTWEISAPSWFWYKNLSRWTVILALIYPTFLNENWGSRSGRVIRAVCNATQCIIMQGTSLTCSRDGNSRLIPIVGPYLPKYTAPNPRRQQYSLIVFLLYTGSKITGCEYACGCRHPLLQHALWLLIFIFMSSKMGQYIWSVTELIVKGLPLVHILAIWTATQLRRLYRLICRSRTLGLQNLKKNAYIINVWDQIAIENIWNKKRAITRG